MPSFVERYRGGEYEQVWAELLAYGAQVREEPLFSQALAVARETMGRARTNIERIVPRLEQIGYQFAYPDGILDPPPPDIEQKIIALEQLAGPIPLSLRAWYEVGGSVCFMGTHPQLAPESDWLLVDPLVLGPIEPAFEDYIEMNAPDEAPEWIEPVVASLAPDEYHKQDISGGGPYGLWIPDPVVDGLFEGEWNNTTFVNYLRICFRWGGFPGWARYSERPTELLAYLADGLLPL